MFKKIVRGGLRGLRRMRAALLSLAAVAAVIGLLALTSEGRHKGIGTYDAGKAQAFAEALTVGQQKPSGESRELGGRTWYRMAEQTGTALWLEPTMGQIALENTRTGALWLGNPGETELAQANAKGIWATNLRAPILFRYLDEGQSNEKVANTVDQEAKVEWVLVDRGVGVLYSMDKLGFSFYVEYTVEQGELVVRMPAEGVREAGTKRLVSLELLPFFGATPNGPDGYLFVPDGPGGLIRFNRTDSGRLAPYAFPVYGYDPAVWTVGAYENRSDIAFPVFGLNRGTDSYIAVIERGAANASILASPAGINTGFNEVHTRITLRNYYYQPIGLGDSNWKNVFQEQLAPVEVQIRYLLTAEGRSDYVGMAQQYRQYLMTHEQVPTLREKNGADYGQGSPPLMLNLVMSAAEPTPTGEKLVVGTTFKEADGIANALVKAGILNMNVSLTGWNSGGFPGRLPDRFPVERQLGGDSGLRQLRERLAAMGIPLSLNDAPFYATDKRANGFSARSDAIKNINGTTVAWTQGGDWYGDANIPDFYFLAPNEARKKWERTLTELKRLGIGGVHAQTYSHGFSDYRADGYTTREASIGTLQDMLDEASAELGSVQTVAAAYSVGHADHLSGMALDSNYDLIVDEQIPFFPIAIHGLATYSSNPGNLRRNPTVAFLRDIEYGAVPAFTAMAGDTRDMSRTTFASMFSGQFSLIQDQIVEQYEAYRTAGADVWAGFIEGHRQVAAGVYETVYEGGRKIWVNYNNEPYEADGIVVDGLNFKIVEEGRA
ncbi:DUF5696 domain-containing protein [Cohnella sp. GCM10020058]|uniref:DUF5696 domain-containing protein n=1 Tax=Cohnella sp. GCM10020058 TaxID=3317330 RepID=UPI00363FAAD6